MTTALIVCEWFDARGYGLAAAARAFSQNLPTGLQWRGVVCHPPSGSEDLPDSALYLRGTMLQKIQKTPAALLPAVRSLRPAIVHVHGIWTGAIALIPHLRSLGTRTVVSTHGMCEPFILNNNRWKKRLMDLWFHRRCLRESDVIHCLNDNEAQMVADYLGTGHPPRIVLPNGITPPTLTPLPTLVGKTVFLYCGRISEQKNLDLLLDAWAIADLANCAQLFLAGHDDSPYAKRILSRASTLPGLRLLGRISGKDKADAFAASHFGVLSSQAEGLSISLLESLACGRPAIATTACHMPDITGRNLGWIADDPHTYAAALREACNLDSRRRLEMSNNCRDYICAYHHWPTLGNRMGHLYMDLCAGKRISDLQSFCPVNQP